MAVCGVLVLGAPSASAAPPDDAFTCRALALDVSTGPLPLDPILDPIEGLISAGSDDASCVEDDGSPVGGTLDHTVRPVLRSLGIDVGALTTTTTNDPSKPTFLQEPKAFSKVAGLDIGVADVASILEVDALETTVRATCQAGAPAYTGRSQIGQIRAFGRRVDLDLDKPVTRLAGLLGPLGPIVELRPNIVRDGGRTRVALRVTVLGAAGIRLLELDVARSTVRDFGAPCALPAAPTVDAPVVAPGTRTITARVEPPAGPGIASCSFTVAPAGGGSTLPVQGTYVTSSQRCEAPLPFVRFPNGDYTATATATTDGTNPGSTTSPAAPFMLSGPALGTPALNGTTVLASATPGSGADPLTGASCVVTLRRSGGTVVDLRPARFEDGACRATANGSLPAGEYEATVTVTDSNGEQVTKTATVTASGPTVGVPRLDGREITADVTATTGRTIASCSFALTREGRTETVTGTVAGGRCTATLRRADFPAGGYAVVASAVDDVDVSGQNVGVVDLRGPSVDAPVLDGRQLTVPARPGSGSAFDPDACTVTINRPGGTTQTLVARYENGACRATIPDDVQPGVLLVETVVKDRAGDEGAGSGQVTLHGPSVGVPAISGRTVAADVVAEDGTSIASCGFVLTRAGGAAETVPGTFSAGRCTASLPHPRFVAGSYAIVARATDNAGASTTRQGTGTIADPATLTVGTPTNQGRDVSAPVTVPAGATAETCTVDVTPKGGGGTTRTFTGTLADGRCSVTLPKADYPVGTTYVVVVEATDGIGRTATGSGEITISVPAVAVGKPTIDGRDVTAPVTVPNGATATACELVLTAKAGGGVKTVTGTMTAGTCKATLPRSEFPPGEYDALVKVTDDEDRTSVGTGPLTVAGPTVGTPIAIGPVVSVPVTPGAGATVKECALTVTPAAGGTPRTVQGTYDATSGTCSAVLPAGTYPSGDYDVSATVTDSNGDSATNSGRVTVAQFGGLPTTTPAGTTTTVLGASEVAQSLLACEGGRIALIEARLVGSRVRVSGVALPSMAGREVLVRLSVVGKGIRTVARTTVRKDGQFAATVGAPPRADRRTAARAKYVAQINATRSGSLRLTRRTSMSSVTTSNGRIRISGRVSAPYPKAGTRVLIGQRISCTSYRTVARTTTTRSGRFSASFPAAKGGAALYRVETKVPSTAGAPARNRSFSLPRIVTAR